MLRRITALFALLIAAGALLPATAAAGSARYIVVLKKGTGDPGTVARQHERRHDASVTSVWRHALKGYAAKVPTSQVAALRRDSRVDFVERDRPVRALKPPWAGGGGGSTAETLPWGVDRVDGTLDNVFGYPTLGANTVYAYVIDTGIDTAHSDLNVVAHVNYAGGKNTDCHGHGTHVAGSVAARDNEIDVIGVAPAVALVGVKVLGCGGSGTTTGVIDGVNFVTSDAKARGKAAVANMSLGGGASEALDQAVRTSAAAGVFYSIAAGNDGVDACTQSPAAAGKDTGGANGVVTVAATDNADAETSWSNYGSCVELWAPGDDILSTRKGGGTTTMSGTSMAAPHVGGAGARYSAKNLAALATTNSGAAEGQLESDAQGLTTKSKDGTQIKLVKGAY